MDNLCGNDKSKNTKSDFGESSPSQALRPGTRLEEFVIERVLGSGGFGITYLAKDSRLGRQVVIKENLPVQFCWREPSSLTVRPRHSEGDEVESFAWSLENFEKEAAMLASLDHPGIVRVLRSFEAFGTAFFVMPFVEGKPLDAEIRNRREQGSAFSEEEISGLLWRMLQALEYLHARGIYHRDIKPGNILITHEGLPVMIDFGSARQRLSERSLTVIESPGYTPFEQLQSRGKIGPWSDLYALGGTLYKAITGETPPKATDRIMEDPIVPLAQRTDLRRIYLLKLLESIDRSMALRINDRLRSSAEWRDWVWGGAGGSESTSRQVSPGHTPPPLPVPNSTQRSGSSGLDWGAIGDSRSFEIGGWQQVILKYVPGGEFLMGSPKNQKDRNWDEYQVRVKLSSHYWMGKTQVTQGQWEAVMGSNPSQFKGATLPVEQVSHNDAVVFLWKLNAKGRPAAGWRWALPSEAQWERACRGGTEMVFCYGDSLDSTQANFDGNVPYGNGKKGPFLEKTVAVKCYAPNEYGLYDMHGNVWEWCSDWYGGTLPGGVNPLGAKVGSCRLFRGGSWGNGGGRCRSAYRGKNLPNYRVNNLGFRLAVVPEER